MGFKEMVALGAVLVAYGSVMLHLHKRPFTFIVLFFEEHKGPFLWVLIANLCELALIFWALRIFHLVFYGNDAPA